MVILKDKPIDMPRPFCGDAPAITIGPRPDGKSGRYITVQITGPIETVYQYLEFIQVLDMATSDDVIDVMLDTPGGCVFTTQVLLEHMNSCKAQVTSVANGLVASAGTFLWFFSKNKRVNDWATFMFHSSSHVDMGKSLSIQETAKEMVAYMQNTVKAMIKAGIMTAEEAGKIFKQKKDLFLPGSIIRSRMLSEMAATEGIILRAEGADGDYSDPKPGEDFKNDRPEDPEGKKDEQANDDVDGQKTDFNPEAILAAEGIQLNAGDGGEGGEGGTEPKKKEEGGEGGEGETQTGENGEGEGTPAGDKCGKGKKGKKKAKAKDGEDDDDGNGEGEGAPGSETNPVPPEKAESMNSYLKW